MTETSSNFSDAEKIVKSGDGFGDENTNIKHVESSESSHFHSLPSEIVRRISTFLTRRDACFGFSLTSKHLQCMLSFSTLEPRPLIGRRCFYGQRRDESGDDPTEPREAFMIPLYKNVKGISIHSVQLSLTWFDQVFGNQHGKIYVTRHSNSSSVARGTSTGDDCASSGRTDSQKGTCSLAFSDGEIAFESPTLAPHTPQRMRLSFNPTEGEYYHLWYTVGNDSPQLALNMENVRIGYLIFDNDEKSFGKNYKTLINCGVMSRWEINNDAVNTQGLGGFYMDLLMSTCRSLRIQVTKKEENETVGGKSDPEPTPAVIDGTMSSFFDRHGIVKTKTSLQVIEDILQSELDEKKAYRESLDRERGGQQSQRRGAGVAIGGGIRITIDQQLNNGNNANGDAAEVDNHQRVHQFHIGGDEPHMVGGNEGQPRVFVHRMDANEGFAGNLPPGLQEMFAAAAAAAGVGDGNGNNNNNDEQQHPQPNGNDGVPAAEGDDISEESGNDVSFQEDQDNGNNANQNINNINNEQQDEEGGANEPDEYMVAFAMDIDGDAQGGENNVPPPVPEQPQQPQNNINHNMGFNMMQNIFGGAAVHQQAPGGGDNNDDRETHGIGQEIPPHIRNILNDMQFPMGFLGNVMNGANNEANQPVHDPGNERTQARAGDAAAAQNQAENDGPGQRAAANNEHVEEERETEVHVVRFPTMQIPMGDMGGMFQQMAAQVAGGVPGVGNNIPFMFPNNNNDVHGNNHPNNMNDDDDDIPEID